MFQLYIYFFLKYNLKIKHEASVYTFYYTLILFLCFIRFQSNPQTSSISFIHQQELQLKIAENESLHKQLQEAQSEYQRTVQHLESRLEVLERNKDGYEKQIDDGNSKNNAIVNRMKEEQIMLNARAHKLEEDLKFSHIMTEKQ